VGGELEGSLALPRQIRLQSLAALIRGFQSGQRFPGIPAGVAGAIKYLRR